MMLLKYENRNDSYICINDILLKEFHISTHLRTKLIKNKCIYLNNNICDTRDKISIGDTITVNLNSEEDNSNIVPTPMNLNIIYEDDWFLILHKPAGIAIHPSMLHFDTSLSNGVRYYFDSIGLKKKIRPVNRLDLNTSGLVIFAKCEYIQECLSKQMENKTFKKEYLCIVSGKFEDKIGTINLPTKKKKNSILERCVDDNGQKSITHFEVLQEFNDYSLVKCTLETGRTHQIRVHMSYIGHPLFGDTLYGKSSSLIDRQALHCSKLEFIHPISKQNLTFDCPLENDLQILANHLFSDT